MARPKKEDTKKPASRGADPRPTTSRDNRGGGNRGGGNRSRGESKGNSNRIGALWINRKGQNTFMSGEIELEDYGKVRILVFKNTYKESDNQPDYNILLPRDERRSDRNNQSDNYDDDIPF